MVKTTLKEKVTALQNFESVKKWLDNFPDRPRTKWVYSHRLYMFTEWMGKNPDQLLAEGKENSEAVNAQVKRYLNHLTEQRYSSNSVAGIYTAIRSFFSYQNVALGKWVKAFEGHVEHESSRVLKHEEILAMIDHCTNSRDKALTSFLAQGGQRLGVHTTLKYKHVRAAIESGEVPAVIEIPAILRNIHGVNVNKERVQYRFTIGQDAVKYLKRMIEERRQDGETIEDESWLFRGYSRGRNGGGKFPVKISKSERGPPLTENFIRFLVNKLAQNAGIQKQYSTVRDQKPRFEVHPHMFRSFTNLCWQQAGLSQDLREMMLAHKDRYNGTYSRWNPEAIRQEWVARNVDGYIGLSAKVTVLTPEDAQLQVTKTTLIGLQFTPEQIEQILKLRFGPKLAFASPTEQIQVLQQALQEKWKAKPAVKALPEEPIKKKCADGEHCQRIVAEAELEGLLAEGWHVVTALPSGKIVVSNE